MPAVASWPPLGENAIDHTCVEKSGLPTPQLAASMWLYSVHLVRLGGGDKT
jgi:hypothetical protein